MCHALWINYCPDLEGSIVIKHPMYVGVPNIFLNKICVRRQCTELGIIQQIILLRNDINTVLAEWILAPPTPETNFVLLFFRSIYNVFLWLLDLFRRIKYRLDVLYLWQRTYFAYENKYDLIRLHFFKV